MGFKVIGARQLDTVARVLTEKGNSAALKRRMTKALNSTADPLKRDQLQSLASGLPKRGGASAQVSSETRITVQTSYVRGTVTLVDRWPGHDMTAIDRGSLRHPLYGNREHWFDTAIPPGLLSVPFARNKRRVQVAMVREMNVLAQEIARET